MKRRNLIAGLGGLAASSGLLVGTGAFTSVNATRSVSVSTAEDDSAYLKLTERGSGARSLIDGDKLSFTIPGTFDDDYPSGVGTDPEGVGSDSVYRFSGDAAHNEDGLFGISNQGTQPVEIYSTQATTSGVPSVTIYDVGSGDLLTESSPSAPLGTGEQLLCGLEIDTHGVDTAEYDVTLTINAVAPDASD